MFFRQIKNIKTLIIDIKDEIEINNLEPLTKGED